MKKIIVLCAVTLIFIASGVFADFVPPQIRFSAPATIPYDFDGDPLRFDVTVTGTAAQSIFLVYTKDKAEQIVNVQNGYLGWHLMNKVDTCIYMSEVKNLPVGTTEITWDGKENNAGKTLGLGLVPPGDYTYYLWGFDAVNQKINSTSILMLPETSAQMTIVEKDEQGNPDPNPLIIVSIAYHNQIQKWALGNEPTNDTLIETTSTAADMPSGYIPGQYSCLNLSDRSILYVGWKNRTDLIQGYYKFAWKPNADAVREPNWGEDISLVSTSSACQAGVMTDGTYLFSGRRYKPGERRWNDFVVVDYDGNLVENMNLMAESERRGYPASGVYIEAWFMTTRNNKVFINCNHCYRSLGDYYRYEESGEIDDFLVWGSGNGDYVCDTNFQEDSPNKWTCLGEDFHGFGGGHPYNSHSTSDNNMFSMGIPEEFGNVSFFLLGPDGTGIGNFSYAGEVLGTKVGIAVVDAGSAYDGIYSDNRTILVAGESGAGCRFCAQDSFKGIITSNPVSVEENVPAAFSVSQNLPNPFNPTTTISFTLPVAGIVSIDVYNVAGQKVDTVVNEYMNTGSHSVVWDGSEFSTGVYFYTVKSNNFTKSMKMTLMK